MPTPSFDSEQEFLRHFPQAECVSAISELASWTSVQDICAAARCVESRPEPNDEFENTLVMPICGDPRYALIVHRVIGWLTSAYRIPKSKIYLATTIDTKIRSSTLDLLIDARLSPTIKTIPLGERETLPPSLKEWAGQKALLFIDEPMMIELVQAPIRCLMEFLARSFKLASDTRRLQEDSEIKTGGRPTIYHRHYADSPLAATLEALCFYECELAIGPSWASKGHASIEVNYRAINVRAAPPINQSILDAAHKANEELLRDLG